VSKIKRLIASYNKYIAIPWRSDAAAAQRVIFCVYNESDEHINSSFYQKFINFKLPLSITVMTGLLLISPTRLPNGLPIKSMPTAILRNPTCSPIYILTTKNS
jgi:hypothetical protein